MSMKIFNVEDNLGLDEIGREPQDTLFKNSLKKRENLLTLPFSFCVQRFVLSLPARSELRNVWNDF